MKRILLLTFILISISLKSQNDTSAYKANSLLQLGAGVGATFGMAGVRTVIGYKGNGMLVGMGIARGKLAKQIGFQLSYKWFFMSMTTGDYATYIVYNTDNYKFAEGQTFITGGHVDISGTKRIFLEIGVGYSWGDSYTNEDGNRKDLKKIAYSTGVLFNI